jgi:hypothetical protein
MHNESHTVGAEHDPLDTLEAFYPVPAFRYSYELNTGDLRKTNLVTGEHIRHRVLPDTFKNWCCWSEVPGVSLLSTGGREGEQTLVDDVVRIDTRREFAVVHCASMLNPRVDHAQVYHTPHLYVLGGANFNGTLRECERYVCAENRWEALPPLPRACSGASGVVLESCLYALGGDAGSCLDLVQKLSLESLTWELMQFRLPFAVRVFSCFKLRDTEVYLVVNQTLYSFTAFSVRPLKTLTECTTDGAGGPSYYFRGILYPSEYRKEQDYGLGLWKIGSLSN